jgi:hypothetical protein
LLERICGNLAKHGLELGKQLLDRIQVRAVCRKVEQNCTPGFDRLFNTFDHVNARIVHEYDIVLLQSRSEELFDVGLERFAIHGAFEHKGGGNPVVTQCCDECNGLPVSVQHFLDEPLTLRCSAVQTCNRRRYGGFIDEYELSWIELLLSPLQRPSGGGHVRAILLGCPQAFF